MDSPVPSILYVVTRFAFLLPGLIASFLGLVLQCFTIFFALGEYYIIYPWCQGTHMPSKEGTWHGHSLLYGVTFTVFLDSVLTCPYASTHVMLCLSPHHQQIPTSIPSSSTLSHPMGC